MSGLMVGGLPPEAEPWLLSSKTYKGVGVLQAALAGDSDSPVYGQG